MVELSEVNAKKWDTLLRQADLLRNGIGVRATPKDNEPLATKIGRPQKYFPSDQVQVLVADYKAGMTVYELASRFGCHRQTISRHLRANGVKMRDSRWKSRSSRHKL